MFELTKLKHGFTPQVPYSPSVADPVPTSLKHVADAAVADDSELTSRHKNHWIIHLYIVILMSKSQKGLVRSHILFQDRWSLL